MENKETTTIRVTKETASELAALGKKGETYEDIIRRLLEGKKPD